MSLSLVFNRYSDYEYAAFAENMVANTVLVLSKLQ